MFEQIISKEDVNTSRQYEFDIAKGFAIIFMVLTHVFLVGANTSKTVLHFVVDNVIGGPLAAPIFMTCMGIGICFSKNSTPKKLFFRGLNLLGIAYGLNICRICMPYTVVSVLQNSFDTKLFIITLVGMDILQFAGLAFIFISLLKKIRINNFGIFLIAVVCALIGTIYPKVNCFQTESVLLTQIIGMFLPTKSLVLENLDIAFPFFNWIVFPLYGLLFGNFIKKVMNKNKFYTVLFVLTSILTIIFVLLNMKYGLWYMANGSYYHADIFSSFFYTVIVLLCFSINYFLLNILCETVKNILYKLSKHINSIYCIHWTIIGWCGFIPITLLGFKAPNEYVLLILSFIILYISTIIALLWEDKLKPYLINQKNKD